MLWIFVLFAACACCSALMVVVSRHPVRAVLFLVLTFFFSAALWLMLQAEFLSLVLIFVYVGAVMTLFLFVVMMLTVADSVRQKGTVSAFVGGLLLLVLLMTALIVVVGHYHPPHLTGERVVVSHTLQMGQWLFTHDAFPLELAALVLLVALVAAIALAQVDRRPDNKGLSVEQQYQVSKADRLVIIRDERHD